MAATHEGQNIFLDVYPFEKDIFIDLNPDVPLFAHWRQTQRDLTMMTGLAAMERTEKQWYPMLDAAGLKIGQIYTYRGVLRDSIIVAVRRYCDI